MKFFVFPYTQNSNGAIEIAAELEGKRILREGSSYKEKADHIIINWGASDCPYKTALNYNNQAVLNKKTFFDRLAGTGLTPAYATSLTKAAMTLKYPVFCRTKVKGRDGAGIVIADKEEQLVNCDLYVQGVSKSAEYRIHVGRLPNGNIEIIGSQKKIKKAKTAEMTNIPADDRIWCGDTCGLVWTVHGEPVHVPPSVLLAVTEAFKKFPELTFGGFDAIYNSQSGEAYVIEINSAPMMTPETRRLYGIFFRKYAELANLPKVSVQPAPVAAPVTAAAPKVDPVKVAEELKQQVLAGKLTIDELIQTYMKVTLNG